MEKPKNIFIDCTATYYTGLNTGIQRVVRNIIARIDYIEGKFGVKCTPVILKEDKFIPITKEDLLNKKPNQKVLKAKVLLSKILPSKIYFFAKNLYGRLFLFFAKPSVKSSPIVPQKGDCLLGIDVFWELGFFDAVKNYKENFGIFFFLFLHDIAPLLYPSFFPTQTAIAFKKSLSKTKIFDAILTSSYSNLNQIKSLDEKFFPDIKDKPIGVVPLGCDIKQLSNSLSKNDYLKQIVENGEIFLMIGTLEPRKNHDFVLSAFEKVWEKDLSKKLVIVGRIGWLCEKTLKRIKSSKYYNKNLFMFNYLSDEDLSYLYKNARAVILASAIEGFGLPLVEAMYYNVPVIASDIDIFKEVGKDYPLYFSLSDINNLVDSVNNFKTIAKKNFKPANWDESVEQFFGLIFELYQHIKK